MATKSSPPIWPMKSTWSLMLATRISERKADHLIATAEAEKIVEWLEVIQVEIADGKGDLLLKELLQLLLNGHVARQAW